MPWFSFLAPRRLVFYAKSVLAVTLLSSCAIYGVVASVTLACVGKRHLAQWATARAFQCCCSLFLGIKVHIVSGEEHLSVMPAVFVSNHQSEMDILVLGSVFPKGCSITAKSSLKWIPFLGWFMSLSGTFFLDRTNRDKSVVTLNNSLTNLVDKNLGVWIYPEGTRSYSTNLHLLPFKKGAFHLAQQAQIPIIPIVVSNTSTIYSTRHYVFNRGVINCKVLDPIPTKGLTAADVTDLAAKVETKMLQEYAALGYADPIIDTTLPPLHTSPPQILPGRTKKAPSTQA